MAFLNHNIPVWKAKIRLEYLYNFEKHHGEEEEVIIVKSKPKTVKKPIIKKAPTKVDEVIQPQPTAVSYRSRGWGNGNFRFV